MPQETQDVLAIQSLGQEPTGIDRDLLVTLIAYEQSRDAKTKINLLQKADKNQSLKLLLQLTDPDNPLPAIPESTIHNLQNLRNTLVLVQTFKADDGYLNILPRTNWIAPPDGTVKVGYSKTLVEAIALAHAYELATTRDEATRYYNALINLVAGPGTTDTQSAEFQRIVFSEGSSVRLPRLIRVYVEVFARAEAAKVPKIERKPDALAAMQAANHAILTYKFDTTGIERKHYEQAYRIALNKLMSTEKPTDEAKAIAADINAGFTRKQVSYGESTDVSQLKAVQKSTIKSAKTDISNLSRSGTSDMNFNERAIRIRQRALSHNRSANIPPVPQQMGTLTQLKDYSTRVSQALDASEKQLQGAQVQAQSGNAARGIGIITGLDSSPYMATKRTMLGDSDVVPGTLSEKDIGRIRKMSTTIGINP